MSIDMRKRFSAWKKTEGRCWYCGVELFEGDPETEKNNSKKHTQKGREQYKRQFSVDHVVPKTDGGGDELDNLVPCCRVCNQRKNNRPLQVFRRILAWKMLVGFEFNQKQKDWLKEQGFNIPKLEENFLFYGETLE